MNGSAMNAASWVTVIVTSALAVYLGVATVASGWTDAPGWGNHGGRMSSDGPSRPRSS